MVAPPATISDYDILEFQRPRMNSLFAFEWVAWHNFLHRFSWLSCSYNFWVKFYSFSVLCLTNF